MTKIQNVVDSTGWGHEIFAFAHTVLPRLVRMRTTGSAVSFGRAKTVKFLTLYAT